MVGVVVFVSAGTRICRFVGWGIDGVLVMARANVGAGVRDGEAVGRDEHG